MLFIFFGYFLNTHLIAARATFQILRNAIKELGHPQYCTIPY